MLLQVALFSSLSNAKEKKLRRFIGQHDVFNRKWNNGILVDPPVYEDV